MDLPPAASPRAKRSYVPVQQAVGSCKRRGVSLSAVAMESIPVADHVPLGEGTAADTLSQLDYQGDMSLGTEPDQCRTADQGLFISDGLFGDEDTNDTVEGLLALRNHHGNAIFAKLLKSTEHMSYDDNMTLCSLLEEYYSGLPSDQGSVALYLLGLPQLQYFGAAVTLEKAILDRLSDIIGQPLTSFTRANLSSVIDSGLHGIFLSAETQGLICKALELREAVLDPLLNVHVSIVDTSSVHFLLVVNMVSLSSLEPSPAAGA